MGHGRCFAPQCAAQRKAPPRQGRAGLKVVRRWQLSARGLRRQRREQQQRDDVGDLDHRVDGRAGGILVRIADRVAGHRGLMGFAALAAVIAVFDILLGIVPGAAARGHRDGDEQAGDDHAEQQGADRGQALRRSPATKLMPK